MHVTKRWSKLSKWAVAGLLSYTILLGNVFPVHAAPPAATPKLSSWSVKTLNEGDKYGIFPLNWYYDESFLQAITPDKFKTLMNGTAAKLDKLGFKKKAASLTYPKDKVITREKLVTSLHQLLANYELPKAFGITNAAPIDYMKQHGIVMGTNLGLELDKASTTEQAVVMARRLIEFAYDTAGAGAEGLMWKVTNGKNTLYLLGSVHLGTTDMYPMQKSIREAFEASDDLWVEVNIFGANTDANVADYFREKMTYKDGKTVKDHVSADTYAKLQKAMTKMKLPANSYDGLKPFVIGTNLSRLSYYEDPAEFKNGMHTGIDSYFMRKAMLEGKPIRELEGAKLQADVLSNVSMKQQEKELNELLDVILSDTGLKETADSLKQMQTAWMEGDAVGLAKMFNFEGPFSDLNKRILGERDKNMAKKLAELLETDGENTHFVVVGAGHYVVKGMVVDLLKEKGYTVQALQ